ncbi:MAG TPA: cysteine hydrolase family protein [Ruminiclostridium sp.]|nr:cysteine hydrolase family protein [Ruminiclostridium sp.]
MKRALLVIDVQNEYFTGRTPVSYPQDSLSNIIKAVDAANLHNIPVIFIQHTSPSERAFTFRKGSHGWEIHPELQGKNHIHTVEKHFPGSFTDTNLEDILKSMDIDTVTISGYMTQMCCDTTARQAMHMGYAVEFLSDATGTLDSSNSAGTISAEDLHKAVLVVQASAFSKVMSTAEWSQKL